MQESNTKSDDDASTERSTAERLDDLADSIENVGSDIGSTLNRAEDLNRHHAETVRDLRDRVEALQAVDRRAPGAETTDVRLLVLAQDALRLAHLAQSDHDPAARIETAESLVGSVLSEVMISRGADSTHLWDTKDAVREAHFGTADPFDGNGDGPTVRRVLAYKGEAVTEDSP